MEWEPAENDLSIKNMAINVKCKKFSSKLELNRSLLK